MADISHRQSPLHGLADRLDAGNDAPTSIRLAEVPFLTKLTLRVAPGTAGAEAAGRALGAPPPVAPNTASRNGDIDVLWIGPDEWLVVGPDGAAGRLHGALDDALAAEHATVVDISAHHTVIEVAGAHARDVLLKGCALDLHARAFGPGQCAQTALARAQVVLLARTPDAYCVCVRASFAEYVAEWLLDAAAEYRGAPPSGFPLGSEALQVAEGLA
jgi:sarcosine oxidase subunit gamma